MRYKIGQRWAVRRWGKNCPQSSYPDFDWVIIGKGSKPDRKLCRIEWIASKYHSNKDFEAEYTHKHIKKCAVLVK